MSAATDQTELARFINVMLDVGAMERAGRDR